MEFELAFVKAGGLLAAGGDPTGNGGALPGFGDQRNYELLLETGFKPEQAVQILTLNGAKVLRLDAQTGSIVAGKDADLIAEAWKRAAVARGIDAGREQAARLHERELVRLGLLEQ